MEPRGRVHRAGARGIGAPRVLLVDGDDASLALLERELRRHGFEIAAAGDASAGLEAAREADWDVVVVAAALPGRRSGLDLCRALRARRAVPIVILSARAHPADRARGLDAGADDYLGAPWVTRELVSRLRALLRRRTLDRAEAVGPVVGDLRLDLARHEALVGERRVRLTPSELRLLALLAERPGEVVSRRRILERLWQSDHVGDEHACEVHVSNLRRKIERDPGAPERLLTVRGQGYLLVAPPAAPVEPAEPQGSLRFVSAEQGRGH